MHWGITGFTEEKKEIDYKEAKLPAETVMHKLQPN